MLAPAIWSILGQFLSYDSLILDKMQTHGHIRTRIVIIMRSIVTAVIVLLTTALSPAALISLSESDFSLGAPSLSFDSIASGTEVNGLAVDVVTFEVSLNGIAANGLVIIDGGPGVTNHITPPNIVSIANTLGLVLNVTFQSFYTQFGYGFAILATGDVSNATSNELFSGLTSLGSLSVPATSDPDFAGGFAGVRNTTPFDRAQLSFSNLGDAFAVDNLRFGVAEGVPEGGSIFYVFGLAVVLLGICANRQHAPRRTRA